MFDHHSLTRHATFNTTRVYIVLCILQNFRSILKLMKEAFFKHGEKDNLRACVKAIKFCSSDSQGELQDFAQNLIKDLEDDLVAKLNSAMKDVMVLI